MGSEGGRLVELQCLEGHEGGAWHCAWSPRGSLLATCGADRVARVWGVDPSRGATAGGGLVCLQVLDGQHTRAVRSVEWSGDGRRVVTASFDGTVGVWEVVGEAAEGLGPRGEFECVATLEGHENEVKGACFSPSGSYVATCGRDKTVWVWEVLDDLEFELVHVGTAHTQDVKRVAWHPARDLLVSGSYDDTVVLWAPGEEAAGGGAGEWRAAWTGSHGATVWDAAWDAEGARLATCDGAGRVAVWRLAEESAGRGSEAGLATGLVQVAVRDGCGGGREVFSVDWAAGDCVAVGCGDDAVRVLSAAGPASFSLRSRQTKMLSVVAEEAGAHAADVNCVRWHPHAKRPGDVPPPSWAAPGAGDGPVQILASASDDGTVRLWQLVAPAKPQARGWLG